MLKNKKKHVFLRTCLDNQSWRRKRDLNPRTLLHVYELSKPAPSASWVFLHAEQYSERANSIISKKSDYSLFIL